VEVCSSSLKHLNSDYQLMPRVFGLTGQAMISKEKEHETGLPYKSSGRIHTCGIREVLRKRENVDYGLSLLL